jgi:hypothetical protein
VFHLLEQFSPVVKGRAALCGTGNWGGRQVRAICNERAGFEPGTVRCSVDSILHVIHCKFTYNWNCTGLSKPSHQQVVSFDEWWCSELQIRW